VTRIALRGLATRKLRSALTILAIVLGVAMISGTFTLTNQINGAFDDIFQQSNKGIDTVVSPKKAFDSNNGQEVALELPQSLVATVGAVPGVAKVAGDRSDQGVLVVNGKALKPTGGAPAIVATHNDGFAISTKVVEGAFPATDTEVAVDKKLADEHHLRVGEDAAMATNQGLQPVKIVGIVKFPAATGGATFILDTLAASQKWFDKPGQVSRIVAAAQPGISQDELTRRVRAALAGQNVEVKTGVQDAKDDAKDINDAIGGFLTPALLAFGFVAVFVGAFIIFNTFTITVAQRLREFALLRTLGASRRQVLRSVIVEALLIGLAASLIGIAAGFLVAIGIGALFDAIGFGIPTRSAQLTTNAVVWSLVVGIGVTLVASLVPARRATRIPPIAALREGAELPHGRFYRWSWILAILLALGGAALIVNGFSSNGTTSQRLLGMGLGALLVFIGVAMTARYAVPALARVIGWPIERIAGTTGRLARENASRNPSRTAITSAALMIGLALVVFVSVVADGLKSSIRDAVRGSLRADVLVQSSTFGRLPGQVVPAVQNVDGIKLATGFYTESVKDQRNHSLGLVGVVPNQLDQMYSIKVKQGTLADFEAIGRTDGAAVDAQTAKDRGWKLGSVVKVHTQAGRSGSFTIRAIYDDVRGTFTGFLVDRSAFDRISTNRDVDQVLALAKNGVSADTAAANVKAALAKQYPLADAKTSDQLVQDIENSVNTLVYLLYALLSMAVVISLFGIVNTLVLSIFERTREIGMLRAIGETRWQLRWMITHESIITAVIGGVLGIIVGLFFGYVISKGLENQGVTFAVPIGQIVVFAIAAVIAGLISAIFPARRAAKLDVLQALQYE
jgi:putative ABC transport system permease protein